MKVKISKTHRNPNISGATGEVIRFDGEFYLVSVGGNEWWVKKSQIKLV